MPPKEKVQNHKHISNGNSSTPECPYCGFHRCWKHGNYKRKGFHRFPSEQRNKIEEVLRYLCRSPSCEHTFSKLPEDILPYCRFMLSGLISIAKDLSAGKSAYWIAKYRWGLSLRVILRAVVRLKEVTPWLVRLYREVTGKVKSHFWELTGFLRKQYGWYGLTRMWYHPIYPIRVGHILNPHNLGIKRL